MCGLHPIGQNLADEPDDRDRDRGVWLSTGRIRSMSLSSHFGPPGGGVGSAGVVDLGFPVAGGDALGSLAVGTG